MAKQWVAYRYSTDMRGAFVACSVDKSDAAYTVKAAVAKATVTPVAVRRFVVWMCVYFNAVGTCKVPAVAGIQSVMETVVVAIAGVVLYRQRDHVYIHMDMNAEGC